MGTWTDQPLYDGSGPASVRAVYSDDTTVVRVQVSTGDANEWVDFPVGIEVVAAVADALVASGHFHDVTGSRGLPAPYSTYTP